MVSYEIYKDEKKVELKDIALNGSELNDCTIINTGAIIEKEALKGALITIKDKKGNDKVLTITSNTPLMVTIAE